MRLVQKKTFLFFYIFTVGIATMGLEMSASRLFAPHLGATMVVWAALIGVILLALAGGYVWGGRLADRYPRPQVIFWITLAVGLWIAAIPITAPHLIKAIGSIGLTGVAWLATVSIICSVVLLGPPIMGLGMVTPFVLRLILDKVSRAGEVAGGMFAISTTGNILGVFLPTLVTIPLLGTWQTIEGMAGLLIIVSIIGLGAKSAPGLLLAVPFFFFNPQLQSASKNHELVTGRDSFYQFVRVEKDIHGPARYLVTNEGGGTQSVAGTPGLYAKGYWDYFPPLVSLAGGEGQKKVLVLGSAGGTIARQIRRLVPGHPLIIGVEIDPLVIEYGYRYFDNKSYDQVISADGRRYLQESDQQYDLIIVDAYSQQMYIPFHMATKEFFRLAQNDLADGGILAMNVGVFSANSKLMLNIASTLKDVFQYLYVVPLPHSFSYVMIASDKALDWGSWKAASLGLEPLVETMKLLAKEAPDQIGGLVFTDNRAPVEFTTDREYWQFMREVARRRDSQL